MPTYAQRLQQIMGKHIALEELDAADNNDQKQFASTKLVFSGKGDMDVCH